ncbi:MAG: ECF-type sigma factor [Gemmatimonadaceae bacterium]
MSDGGDDVTRLLDEVRRGESGAADRLARVVYQHLHRIAENALRRESAGHTLQATELVDEAFVRLLGQQETTWENRSQFYAVAARIIRRILVDHERRRRPMRRDHGVRVTLDNALSNDVLSGGTGRLDLIALDLALQQLEALSPRQGRVVELRFFAGLDVDQAAEVLDVSPTTMKRDWRFARALLLEFLSAS